MHVFHSLVCVYFFAESRLQVTPDQSSHLAVCEHFLNQNKEACNC